MQNYLLLAHFFSASEWPYFLILAYEWPRFSDTYVYAHIFRSDTRQAFVFTLT